MKLKFKTLLVVVSSIIIFFVFLLILVRPILLDSYLELEYSGISKDITRVKNSLDIEMHHLHSLNRDWAVWDETYYFIKDRDLGYINSNLLDDTFVNNEVNFMIYLNSDKDVVFQKGFDYRNEEQLPISPEDLTMYVNLTEEKKTLGILNTSQGITMVSVHPTITSDGTGVPNGHLLMGRHMDKFYMKEKGGNLALDLTVTSKNITPDLMSIDILDEETAQGNLYIQLLNSEEFLSFSFIIERDIFKRGKDSVNTFFFYYFVGLILFTILIIVLLNKYILSRIFNLTFTLRKIQKRKDLTIRVGVNGRDELSYLEKRINHMLASIELAHKELKNIAYCDALTGLYNRGYLFEKFNTLLERRNIKIAVVFLDLDGFKPVNDTLGHKMGDSLLKKVSKRLQELFSKNATITRLGGDEFIILLEYQQGIDDVKSVTEELINCLKGIKQINGFPLEVTGSVGVSLYPEDGETPHDLVQKADIAMYEAKRNGKNQYYFYNELKEDSYYMSFGHLERDLRRALDNQELELYYQPIINSEDYHIIGVEALLRWNHPVKGMISPLRFIPIAEEIGLMNSIGEWVLRTSINQVQQWHQDGFDDISLYVNLSKTQMVNEEFLTAIDLILKESHFPSEHLQFEITENTVGDSRKEVKAFTEQLRKRNLRIALDDFGTGLSSLVYLRELNVDTIKIDRHFIMHIPMNKFDTALLSSIISMCNNLGIEVVAEGIETKEQLSFIKSEGCKKLQGFIFSKPIDKDDFERLLKSGINLKS